MAVQPITHPLVHFRLPLRVPVPRAPACRPMVRQPRIHEHAHRPFHPRLGGVPTWAVWACMGRRRGAGREDGTGYGLVDCRNEAVQRGPRLRVNQRRGGKSDSNADGTPGGGRRR